MSDQKDQGRKAWVRGDAPNDPNDEFARHAARGRQELESPEAADELLRELDGMLAARYGDAGADAGAVPVEQQRKEAKIRRLPRLYAIAATFLLLIAAGWWWSQQPATFDAEAAYAAAFAPYANDLSDRVMGGGEDDSLASDRTLEQAVLAYDRRDFAAAADAFAAYLNVAPASAPNVSAATLYQGVSLLAAGQPAEAQAVLEPLLQDPTYGHPATWYTALAQLRAGDTTAAKASLQSIAQNESSPFRATAQKLLPDIP